MTNHNTNKIEIKKFNGYEPHELKIIVDALNLAPSYLSKRFILKVLCGWSDEMIQENVRLKREELDQRKIGDITWQ